MANFITGNQLTEEVYDVIHKAKKHLLIVSPYIKLDDYFKEELFENHKKNSELHIIIGFGKNEKNPQRSLKKEDLNYFKDFPNVSIIYIPKLHAKYYANEKKGIITSINLYDYSFKNNVEFGVISETSRFGGSGIDKEAWDATMNILGDNHTVYIRRPNYKKKFLGKDYLGSETNLDLTDELLSGNLPTKRCVFDFMNETYVNEEKATERLSREEFDLQKISEEPILVETVIAAPIVIEPNLKEQILPQGKALGKLISATNLGKIKGKSFNDVIETMVSNNYIVDKSVISEEGLNIGLNYRENAKGTKWIVYPESLAELL
ncbi:phospholipase D family protein [Algibacter sp. L1A34]|uniref:phospholipase D family protein n=1 Tax=Algibacter sp. L1A34 TaxID=2686365 RepID=UPI00131B2EFA|nr:phospholipase D family protein [Algibacter sp. L1A34]